MGHPLKLKTDSSLLHALDVAKSQKMTADEIREQRISFILSSMDNESDVTRERIREVLDEREGV